MRIAVSALFAVSCEHKSITLDSSATSSLLLLTLYKLCCKHGHMFASRHRSHSPVTTSLMNAGADWERGTASLCPQST